MTVQDVTASEDPSPAPAPHPNPLPRRGRGSFTDPVPTYYDQPALKASFYGWKVSAYMFVAGLAGSAQILASAADLTDRAEYARVVRTGRYVALAGAALGAPLLILDLHTPQRFQNMLRIFRPTSPMSIGSYVLTGFGGLSALVAAGQATRDRGIAVKGFDRAGTFLEIPAALLGAAMSTYTGALLSATSTPLWAAAPRLLPALFGASAMSSAAAMLSLADNRPALHRIETVAGAAELALAAALPVVAAGEGLRPGSGVGPAVAAALPLVAKFAGGRKSGIAAAGVLAGAFLVRHLMLRAGNRSAERPRDYFHFARPR